MVTDTFMKAWLTVTRLSKVAKAVTDLWRMFYESSCDKFEKILLKLVWKKNLSKFYLAIEKQICSRKLTK